MLQKSNMLYITAGHTTQRNSAISCSIFWSNTQRLTLSILVNTLHTEKDFPSEILVEWHRFCGNTNETLLLYDMMQDGVNQLQPMIKKLITG